MIGFLRGRLAAKQPPQLVIDVGGIGYELEAPMSTFYSLAPVGAEVSLFTHFVVREDSHVLFGFGSERERRLFRELIKVSGIGPKLGLSLLSGMSVENLRACIERGDIDTLVRIPGVGRKTAERLLVEMRDRVAGLDPWEPAVVSGNGTSGKTMPADPHTEASSALIALGYKPAEVTKLLKQVEPSAQTTEELIRRALQLAVIKS